MHSFKHIWNGPTCHSVHNTTCHPGHTYIQIYIFVSIYVYMYIVCTCLHVYCHFDSFSPYTTLLPVHSSLLSFLLPALSFGSPSPFLYLFPFTLVSSPLFLSQSIHKQKLPIHTYLCIQIILSVVKTNIFKQKQNVCWVTKMQ